MIDEIWNSIIEFVDSESRGIIRDVVVGICVAILSWVVAKIFLLRNRAINYKKAEHLDAEGTSHPQMPISVRRDKLYRPKFEFIDLKSFTNSNGSCHYVFMIENAGGNAFNVRVTSDDFEGEVNLRDMTRRSRRDISFISNGPVYEVCFDFAFDLPDGSSSTASLMLHERVENYRRTWHAGGVGAS